MPGIHIFYPCALAESVFTIDYGALMRMGYKGIIFDIDNTLVPHGKDSTPEVDEFFAKIHSAGLITVFLSNNSRERVERFNKNISSPFVSSAGKPIPVNFRKAAKLTGLDRKKIIYIGDQIFTDILGANLAGLDSILVKYIGYYDEGYKGKRRAAEAVIIKRYLKNKRYPKITNFEKQEG